MIESLLESLAHWPPALVYALIAISCVVETFFPPSPSDVFVTMAAFLSHSGEFRPEIIFAIAWLGGMAGSVGVYLTASRVADRLFESRLGRKLLPPAAMAFLLRQYGRYGAAALFLTRLLPGFRSVVAPFAGLNRIGAVRFLVPVALASALWYGGLTFVGARLGDRWETVVAILDAIYSALGAVAIGLLAALAVGFIWWRRRRPAE